MGFHEGQSSQRSHGVLPSYESSRYATLASSTLWSEQPNTQTQPALGNPEFCS